MANGTKERAEAILKKNVVYQPANEFIDHYRSHVDRFQQALAA